MRLQDANTNVFHSYGNLLIRLRKRFGKSFEDMFTGVCTKLMKAAMDDKN